MADRRRCNRVDQLGWDLSAGCLLVGLRLPQVEHHSIGAEAKIFNQRKSNLGTPGRGREANQDQRTVAKAGEIVGACRNQFTNIRREKRIFAMLCRADHATDRATGCIEQRGSALGQLGLSVSCCGLLDTFTKCEVLSASAYHHPQAFERGGKGTSRSG